MKNGSPSPARMAALQALWEIDAKGAYANVALDRVLSRRELSPEDKDLATELVYGTVRRQGTLDWVLQLFLKKPLPDLTPWIRNILRMGTYQLLFLPRIPVPVACNEGVNLAGKYGHQGTAGLVNAVLRRLGREKDTLPWPSLEGHPVDHLAVVYSHPRWMVERWVERWGVEQTRELCQANNETPPLSMRVNLLKASPGDVLKELRAKGAEARMSALVPVGVVAEKQGRSMLEMVEQGYGLIQDESSMLPGYILDPTQGEKVLDACCGPGGKTTHLAELQGDDGVILAFDLHDSKVRTATVNAARLDLQSITFAVGDARLLQEKPGFQDGFSRILVDVPCSGLGVLRRRADARWRKTPGDLEELPPLQLEILEGAAACLAPGGVLVYSTCTIEPTENQGVVEKFLARHGNFALEAVEPFLPEQARDYLRNRNSTGPYLSLLPQRDGTDGFFAARLRRRV